MIKHRQNILINSDNQKVWAFLIDFSRSLIFDRYYSLIELPHGYSINNDSKFFIKAQYFFKKYDFNAIISNNAPPHMITIKLIDNKISNIYQIKSFKLSTSNNKTRLEYNFTATFNNTIKNTLLYSPMKASCIAELVFLKKAIESSEHIHEGKKVKTILH